ncbi:MAG TPA: hypothetical protein VGI28_01740 [Stellaceae bacterium]|jgi:hypothetical protein
MMGPINPYPPDPQYVAWQQNWHRFLAQQQQSFQQQMAAQQTLPGRPAPNALMGRASVPALGQADPGAGMMGYWMGGGNDATGGGSMSPQMMQMVMGGSGGAL